MASLFHSFLSRRAVPLLCRRGARTLIFRAPARPPTPFHFNSSRLDVVKESLADQIRETQEKPDEREVMLRRGRERILTNLVDAGLLRLLKPVQEYTTQEMGTLVHQAGLDWPGSDIGAIPSLAARSKPADPGHLSKCRQLATQLSIPLPFNPLKANAGEVSDFLLRANKRKHELDPEPRNDVRKEDWGESPTRGQKRLAGSLGIRLDRSGMGKGVSRGELGEMIAQELRKRWRQRRMMPGLARGGRGGGGRTG